MRRQGKRGRVGRCGKHGLRKGLPPTAIGSPTVESLNAAIAPVESEFWYYLHDADGNLHPARNGTEHEANRAKYNVY